MQSRKHSAVETFANVLVGYVSAVASQFIVFPLFGITVPLKTNFIMGVWFTVTSVIRSYAMRRLFKRWEGER